MVSLYIERSIYCEYEYTSLLLNSRILSMQNLFLNKGIVGEDLPLRIIEI
jgi:hypothetical protein